MKAGPKPESETTPVFKFHLASQPSRFWHPSVRATNAHMVAQATEGFDIAAKDSLIGKIPPEVFSEILLFLGPFVFPCDYKRLCSLISVSRLWRETAIATPGLWSHYDLRMPLARIQTRSDIPSKPLPVQIPLKTWINLPTPGSRGRKHILFACISTI
jgi:hypothetical protein